MKEEVAKGWWDPQIFDQFEQLVRSGTADSLSRKARPVDANTESIQAEMTDSRREPSAPHDNARHELENGFSEADGVYTR